MGTPHNNANISEIAKTVIMPGDPRRAKLIAETYLENYKLVNDVRGIFAYTGKYNGKEVTVMASGMGIPSMGIYSYELFKYYDVDNIIRIGSCGALIPELNLFDIVLSKNTYSESNYALSFTNDNCHLVNSSNILNEKIIKTAKSQNQNLIIANTVCSDVFDEYASNFSEFLNRLPKDLNPASIEMEAFSLFYNAKVLNKNASCMMTVVDSSFKQSHATSEEREIGLNKMIKLALDSI